MRAELRAVADMQVFLALGMTLLGLRMVVGNYAGGKFADRRLMPAVLTSLGLLLVALLGFSAALRNLLALGIALFAVGGDRLCNSCATADSDRAAGSTSPNLSFNAEHWCF